MYSGLSDRLEQFRLWRLGPSRFLLENEKPGRFSSSAREPVDLMDSVRKDWHMACFCTLASGSSGNSTYIGSGVSGVLIDVGISCRGILTAMETKGIGPGKHRCGVYYPRAY